MQILVVEDEPVTARVILGLLQEEHHEVRWVTGVGDAIRCFKQSRPDLVILDLVLPDGDGLLVCEAIRASSEVPVLILSGRTETADKVLGLELGADDYLTKPFERAELRSRIRALLRRSGHRERVVSAGSIRLDLEQRVASCGKLEVTLTRTEFELLRTLMSSPGEPVSRRALLRALWGHAEDTPGTRAIDAHVGNLRRKLSAGLNLPDPIAAVRGVGYRFALR
ncbi:MAG: response regulator transcription factor [Candidatus Eremiobacterota bacterium]